MTAQTQDGGRPSPAVERRERIDRYLPALMLVVDGGSMRGEVIHDAVREGVTIVQLRSTSPTAMRDGFLESRLIDGLTLEIFALSGKLLRARYTAGEGALILLSGELGAAIESLHATDALGGDFALHLPERPLRGHSFAVPVQTARARVGESFLLSHSVHSLEAAIQAERDRADMLVLGTVFPSKSHPGGPTIGLEGVREVCAAVTIPVIGIGGITPENAGDVIRAGASGVAVISAIFDAPDPRAAAAELRAAIDEAWRERTEN